MFARSKVRWLIVSVIGVLAVLALFGLFQSVQASGVWYVKNGGDDSADCTSPAMACATINGALGKAGFVAGDTVKVAMGTYVGSGTQVVLVNNDVTLSGGWDSGFLTSVGRSILDGENTRRGLTVGGGIVNVERFEFGNGSDAAQGGAIRNNSTLNIQDSVVRHNRSYEMGGGIFSYGTLNIDHSTISDNTAGDGGSGGGGGAIQNYHGTTTIRNSTISGNTIFGGASSGSAIENFDTLVLENSTVTANTASSVAIASHYIASLTDTTVNGNAGVGLSSSGVLTLQDTILANNAGGDCEYEGTLNDLGYNLIKTNKNCSLVVSDLTGIDPLLGALDDNGGPTQTEALLGGSPAVGKVPVANCPLSSDQRGVGRPQATNCDIGAYEASGDEPTATATATPTITPTPTPAPPTSVPQPTPNPGKGKVKKIVSETFENSFLSPGWKVTAGGWGKSDCMHYAGGHYSAWAIGKTGAACGDNYAVSQTNWMVYGPFSLKKALAAHASLKLWLNSVSGEDGIFVGVTVDGQHYYGNSYSGASLANQSASGALWDATTNKLALGGAAQGETMTAPASPDATLTAWRGVDLDLSNVYQLGDVRGQTKVGFAVVWISDSANTLPNGAFVDNVLITKTVKKKK